MSLRHCFQQCRLGFWSVRLISSARTTLAKTGPGFHSKCHCAAYKPKANHVRRKQIGSELDSLESAIQCACQRVSQGFADARNVFDQKVTAGNQSHYRQPNRFRLAFDDSFDSLCSRSICSRAFALAICPLLIGSRFRMNWPAFYMLRARLARKSWPWMTI